MSELEELRKKKLQEMQEKLKSQFQQQSEMQQQLEMVEAFVKQYMTNDAIQRLGALKAAHPEKVVQILGAIAQAIQAGQIKEKITDDMFKSMLIHLQDQKEFRIKK